MSLVFMDAYGAPDYGTRKGTVAVVLHTTEGPPGRAGALGTARWQATSGNTSGGSYHEIWGVDGDVVTSVRTVPAGHIAGSISTRRDAVWIADTDAELKEYMGSAAVADPNSYVYAISMAGYTAEFEKNGWPTVLVEALAARLRALEKQYGVADMFVCGHYRFQTNRSDPGQKLIPLTVAAYQRLYGTVKVQPLPDTSTITPSTDDWRKYARVIPLTRLTLRGGAIPYRGPDRSYGEHSAGYTFPEGAQVLSSLEVIRPDHAGHWFWADREVNGMGVFTIANSDVVKAEMIATDASTQQDAADAFRARIDGIKSKVAALAVDVAND